MAQGATLYTFDIDLADADRAVYESLALRVARHPSESEEYLVTRVLAYALEFTAGDDVESATEAREQPKNRERGVGFDGVADGVVDAGELAHEHGDAIADIVGGVEVERCAELGGEVA